jgi:hypothetical protein
VTTVTARAAREHGPCATCRHPIRVGHSFRTTLATRADLLRTHSVFGNQAKVKVHVGCPHPDSRAALAHGPWRLVSLASPSDYKLRHSAHRH